MSFKIPLVLIQVVSLIPGTLRYQAILKVTESCEFSHTPSHPHMP